MAHPHEYFERLAVLEISDALTNAESQELQQHLLTCDVCRETADQCSTAGTLMGIASEQYHPIRVPADLVRRLKRIDSPDRVRSWSSLVPIISAAALILVLTTASFFVGRWSSGPLREAPSPPARAMEQPQPATSVEDDSTAQLGTTTAQLKSRTAELRKAQEDLNQLREKRKQLEDRIESLEQANQQGQVEAKNNKEQVEKLAAELKTVRSQEEADHVATSVSETEVRRLKENEAKLKSDLEESRRVQALLADAQQLIVDRNMHTFYVSDDKPGKERHPFGRIFYSEGRLFKFYAWDLSDPTKAKESRFYLWGETQDQGQRIVSLGQFQIDNAADGRWLLKADPKLLAEITSVFVTQEKGVTAKQPTGERRLRRELRLP